MHSSASAINTSLIMGQLAYWLSRYSRSVLLVRSVPPELRTMQFRVELSDHCNPRHGKTELMSKFAYIIPSPGMVKLISRLVFSSLFYETYSAGSAGVSSDVICDFAP